MKPRRRGTSKRVKGPRSPRRALTVLAVIAALGLLYGWNSAFLAPRSRQQAVVHKELTAAHQQERDLKQSLARLRALAADTQSREAELARLGRLVPADPDLAGAILALNDTANRAQVAWSSFVPTPAVGTAAGPATTGVSMKVSGTFGQVFDYLGRLESLERLVVVDSVALTGSAAASGPSKIDADLRARLFSVATVTPPRPAAPAVPAPPPGPAPATLASAPPTALPKAGG